jgi:hypothetical protein
MISRLFSIEGLPMKEQHIKWASQHDWYIGHGVNVENKLFIRVKNDMVADESIDFFSYTELREWAGY